MKKVLSILSLCCLNLNSAFAVSAEVPSELETKIFSDASMTPSPAVICASPYGEVYVGVDMQGSLGKKPNLGYVVKLVDTDNDGKADQRTVYAKVDNPRGLIAIDDRLYVLHSTQKEGVIHTQQITVFTDADKDGVADGPGQPLVTGIGNPKFLKSRGTDHSTNNIRLGIDGWIYIAIGDFGFIDAQGTDGKKLSMHGGGVVRVRPDGSEMETFIHGTRNVYDIAIDPFMNIFTRENTNDGVGWWVRFSHYIQTGEYGYPSLYTNFPEDMLPALGEYGRGSGTGNLFFQEPGWPEKFNNVALMADWGRSHVYIHRIEKDGASFKNTPQDYIGCSQVTDLDVDGSGRMYLSAWQGAGYKGSSKKGFVSIVTPKGWTYKPFPELRKLTPEALVALLRTESATARTYAQQEILRRNNKELSEAIIAVAKDKALSAEGRVAAIYTYAQLAGADALKTLSQLSSDEVLKEHCIRAIGDRLQFAKNADVNLLKAALNDPEPRVQVAAAVALGRTADMSVASDLIAKAAMPNHGESVKSADSKQEAKPHSTPNSSMILPHIAMQAVLALDAQDACIEALNSDNTEMQSGALATMKFMHSEKVVDALISAANANHAQKQLIVDTLIRLHQKEVDYDGSTWWSTRPDPHGPYFYPVDWDGTAKISAFLVKHHQSLDEGDKLKLIAKLKKNKAYVPELHPRPKPKIEVANKVGKTSIEDIVLYVSENKGKPKRGAKIIGKVGCVSCHNTKIGESIKGPDLTKLGNMKRGDIAEAIIKPGASIAKSWVTITMKDGSSHMGTIVEQDAKEIILHNIAGIPTKLDATQVDITEPGLDMMSLHLCDNLTLEELADLIAYLQSMDKSVQKK